MAFRLVKLCAFGAPDCTAQWASLSSRVSRQAPRHIQGELMT